MMNNREENFRQKYQFKGQEVIEIVQEDVFVKQGYMARLTWLLISASILIT